MRKSRPRSFKLQDHIFNTEFKALNYHYTVNPTDTIFNKKCKLQKCRFAKVEAIYINILHV